MKIRKFEGRSEQDVMETIKEELGPDTLILNIKKIQPKGIFAFFRKPLVEVTAAYEERGGKKDTENKLNKERDDFLAKLKEKTNEEKQKDRSAFNDKISETVKKEEKLSEQSLKIKVLEEKLEAAEELVEKAMKELSISSYKNAGMEKIYENNLIQMFYDEMKNQGVLSEIIEEMLDEISEVGNDEEIDIELIVSLIYNYVIEILGEPETVKTEKSAAGGPNIVFFIGSTGVGKTTTIAKLSAEFMFNHNLNVGLITADTYRIAAVEQLKTYGEILGVEVGVVFNTDDLREHISVMGGINDIIFIDTAGRSHKNSKNLEELKELLDVSPESEKYLVLSLTTKYEDLISIIEAYADIAEFKIIFTKLDETLTYGSILNICHRTGKKISYVTTGQNVPDDFEVLRGEKIAKALLGL